MEEISPIELINKCVLEGGFFASLEYGYLSDQLDDSDLEFKNLVQMAEQHAKKINEIESEISNHIYKKYSISIEDL